MTATTTNATTALFLTDEHAALRAKVRAFAETEVAPRVDRMEGDRRVDEGLANLIARQGWIGATIDPAFGGMGVGHLAKTIIIEELSRVSGAMGAMVQASQLGTAKIIHFGNRAQKETWLPRVAAGECLPTIAVTEPGCGSHVLGMEATAQRDGDDYVLSGRKVYVGNSHIGDLHGVVVRTGPGSRGLSAFLVEADRPGVGVGPRRPAMGLHGFSFGDVILDGCRVPADNMIGKEGDGLDVAYSSSVLYGRPNLAAVALGIHQAIVEQSAAFAQERIRYGRPLAELPTIRQRLGQMESRLMTARTLLYTAVHQLDHGLLCDDDLMNAKYTGIEALLDTARDGMRIHAAAGLTGPMERYFRDAQHVYAPAGTGDIQLHRLGEKALGHTRSQWSQRHTNRSAPVRKGARAPAPRASAALDTNPQD
ncbi:acyl-CoA dehydrogenase family protein [Streptomyces sp. MAR4 CNY-716]